MKYFSNILVGHKVFSYGYSGNFIFQVKRVGAQNIHSSHQGDLTR